jgi:hypothetical protein
MKHELKNTTKKLSKSQKVLLWQLAGIRAAIKTTKKRPIERKNAESRIAEVAKWIAAGMSILKIIAAISELVREHLPPRD